MPQETRSESLEYTFVRLVAVRLSPELTSLSRQKPTAVFTNLPVLHLERLGGVWLRRRKMVALTTRTSGQRSKIENSARQGRDTLKYRCDSHAQSDAPNPVRGMDAWRRSSVVTVWAGADSAGVAPDDAVPLDSRLSPPLWPCLPTSLTRTTRHGAGFSALRSCLDEGPGSGLHIGLPCQSSQCLPCFQRRRY
jgi:hypothetical protein